MSLLWYSSLSRLTNRGIGLNVCKQLRACVPNTSVCNAFVLGTTPRLNESPKVRIEQAARFFFSVSVVADGNRSYDKPRTGVKQRIKISARLIEQSMHHVHSTPSSNTADKRRVYRTSGCFVRRREVRGHHHSRLEAKSAHLVGGDRLQNSPRAHQSPAGLQLLD